MSSDPFFILPDAHAGDAKSDVLISIDGTVYCLSAAAVVGLLTTSEATLDYWESTSFAECEPGCDCIVDQTRAAVAGVRGEPVGSGT